MIVLLFGQPAAGKTTIAKKISEMMLEEHLHIDGDEWRDVTKNKDYTKSGRISNLKGAFNTALYLDTKGYSVILSFVCPFKELRTMLAENAVQYKQIYLTYNEDRGRNMNFATLFEEPLDEKQLHIDTSVTSIEDSYKKALAYCLLN